MVLALVVGLWVARYLGPAKFGVFNYVLAAVALVLPLADLGLDAILRREFVKVPREAPSWAGTAFRLRLVGGLGVVLLTSGSAVLGNLPEDDVTLFLVLALTALQPAFLIAESWLQTRLEARRSVLPQWAALVGGAVARVMAIKVGATLIAFAWILVAESALASCWLWVGAYRVGFRLDAYCRSCGGVLLRESWPLALSGVAVAIYMKIDIIMLRLLAGDQAAGIYSAATRVSELVYFLPVAAAASIQPILVRAMLGSPVEYRRHFQRYFNLSAATAYVLAAGFAATAPLVIDLAYGARFAEASSILRVHAWALVFVFLGVARSQYLVNAGLSRLSLWSTGLGAVINVALNFAWVPTWGGVGAAWATVVSYGVAAWLSLFLWRPTRGIAFQETMALLSPWRKRFGFRP